MQDIDLSSIFKNLYPQIRQRAKESDIFKKLTKRKYRPIPGYIDWEEIMVEFAVCLGGISTMINQGSANPVIFLSAELINNYHQKKSPSYWLDSHLCQTLKECDIPEGIKELPTAIDRGLILLPNDAAPHDDNGEQVQWVLFSKFRAGEKLPAIIAGNGRYMTSEPIEKDCILWSSQCPDSGLYSGAITTDFQYHAITPSGFTPVPNEKRMAQEISNLLLQSLLIAEFYPEYTESLPGAGLGFSKNCVAKTKNTYLNPQFIGDLYKKKIRSRYLDLIGTHASPDEHYRRGHWKNQAFGSKWSQHRMILIPPTIVSPCKSEAMVSAQE